MLYGSTRSVNCFMMFVICIDTAMYRSIRGRITTRSGHFAKAVPSVSAVVTPYCLASGQAASTIPERRSGSPATISGRFWCCG
ncbi:hypothetical protein D3C81_1589590 [compost metagenome]